MKLVALTLSQQAFLEYQRWWLRATPAGQRRRRLMSLYFAIIAVIGVIGFFAAHWLGGLALLLGSVIGLPLLRPIQTWKAKRQYRAPQNRALFAPRTFALDENGMTVLSATSQGHLDWAAILAVAEIKSCFILMIAERQAHLIPKSGLSPTQLAGVRVLLREHVPNAQLLTGTES